MTFASSMSSEKSGRPLQCTAKCHAPDGHTASPLTEVVLVAAPMASSFLEVLTSRITANRESISSKSLTIGSNHEGRPMRT